jgi:hypothetical protein
VTSGWTPIIKLANYFLVKLVVLKSIGNHFISIQILINMPQKKIAKLDHNWHWKTCQSNYPDALYLDFDKYTKDGVFKLNVGNKK